MLALAVALCAPALHAADGAYQIEFGAQTYQANNAVSIDQFDANFTGYSPRHSQLYALGENAAYISASRAGFTLQAYKKQEIFINAGRETGQLYADINARIPPGSNKSYAVEFDGYGIEQTGLGFSKTFQWAAIGPQQALSLTPAARLYNINRYREIQAGGFAAARADGSYDIAVNTLERDTRADFTFPIGNSPNGMGYAFDLGAELQISDTTRVFANFQDLLNYNSIKNAPTTAQTLNSNVNQFDADGFLNYNPAIQGQNSRETYDFSLPVKSLLGVQHSLDLPQLSTVGFDIRHIQGLVLPRISVGWAQPLRWVEQIALGYETHFEAFDVQAQFKYGGVRFGFDTPSDESRRVEFLQVYLHLTL